MAMRIPRAKKLEGEDNDTHLLGQQQRKFFQTMRKQSGQDAARQWKQDLIARGVNRGPGAKMPTAPADTQDNGVTPTATVDNAASQVGTPPQTTPETKAEPTRNQMLADQLFGYLTSMSPTTKFTEGVTQQQLLPSSNKFDAKYLTPGLDVSKQLSAIGGMTPPQYSFNPLINPQGVKNNMASAYLKPPMNNAATALPPKPEDKYALEQLAGLFGGYALK